MAIEVTADMISACGTSMLMSIPASAAGITPVSLVQQRKAISLAFHFDFLSKVTVSRTEIGLARKAKAKTIINALPQYCEIISKFIPAPSRMKISILIIDIVTSLNLSWLS